MYIIHSKNKKRNKLLHHIENMYGVLPTDQDLWEIIGE